MGAHSRAKWQGILTSLLRAPRHCAQEHGARIGFRGGVNKMIKRLFDIVFSIIGLTIFLPLLLIVAILIKKEDGGPIFYRGVRVGRYGKLFKMFKFRTMVVNAEKIGGPSTADDDPRLLKVGKFLRKYKLDEFPQLINVLKGEMSFVGPRPEVQHYVNTLCEYV